MRPDTVPAARPQRSLVAFHGAKPSGLTRLLDDCVRRLTDFLGADFKPYALPQIHGTVIGLEHASTTQSGQMPGDNANLERLRGRRRRMDTPGFLAALLESPAFPIQVRFGGFRQGERPFASRGRTPWERSFSIQGDKAVLIGWPILPGKPEQFPDALAELRRRGEEFNILHAYHPDPKDRDNDLYLRLGTLKNPAKAAGAGDARRVDLEDSLREALAAQPITVELTHRALSVVEYTDPSLPQATTRSLDPRTLLCGNRAADAASSDPQD